MNRNKRITRWFLTIALCLALIFSLTACGADLGEFNSDEEDYSKFYESFGDLEGLYDGGSHSYDIEDSLFNEYTVVNLDWEDDDDKVASEEYVYIVIPIKKEVQIESFVLYMNSETEVDVSLSAYYFSSTATRPEKIRYRNSPDTEIIIVIEDGHEVEKEVEIVYDDPIWNDRVGDATCYVTRDWGSFMMERFTQPGYSDGLLHAEEDSYLYLMIENNSGLHRDMQNLSFNFINFIVRAV